VRIIPTILQTIAERNRFQSKFNVDILVVNFYALDQHSNQFSLLSKFHIIKPGAADF